MAFVQLLERKEKLEQTLINRCIHVIDLMQPYRYAGLALYAFLFVLLPLMVVVPGLTFIFSPPRGPPYSLIEPGNYRPRQCAQWKFEDGTESHLIHALVALKDTAKLHGTNLLTGNQMGISFCVLEYREDGPAGEYITMLNPKLVSRSGSFVTKTVKLDSLCGPHNTSRYEARLSREITLSWESPQKVLGKQRFSDQLAYEIQVALLVLRGEDVCQKAPK